MAGLRRYQRYAEELTELIRRGELAPGTRLPSVREASRARRISPATVFEAFYLLQARGLIESRPRSGFFVSQAAKAPPARATTPAPRSRAVAVSELVFEVLEATRRPGIAPLGSAFPGVELFPLRQLSRALSAGMRQLEPARIVEDLPPGNERLRKQIALRYALSGTRVAPGEIVITNGAMEALTLSLQAVTKPGDAVVVESPCFYAALQALERLRLKAVEVPCDVRDGLDLTALRGALRRQDVKACWLMPSFQNPTGARHAGGETARAGEDPRRPRPAADRRRCVCGAVLRRASAETGEVLRYEGARHALWFVLQVPCSRLSSGMGSGRTPRAGHRGARR